MRINPNNEASAVAATPGRTAATGPRLGEDNLAITTTEALNRSLERTPEVRADKVAQASALIQDRSYPPAVIIRKISALLAIKIDPPSPGQS